VNLEYELYHSSLSPGNVTCRSRASKVGHCMVRRPVASKKCHALGRRTGTDPVPCWDMSRFKQPSDTLAASSGLGRPSMIASESNQIPESWGSGGVADKPLVAPLPKEIATFLLDYREIFDVSLQVKQLERPRNILPPQFADPTSRTSHGTNPAHGSLSKKR
jgi:hypothetical protein